MDQGEQSPQAARQHVTNRRPQGLQVLQILPLTAERDIEAELCVIHLALFIKT